MKMNKSTKNRFSIPAKLLDLLWTDESFYNEVVKIKKSAFPGNFPKTDQWKDSAGFHFSLALAGYSPDDIKISVRGNVLTISSEGIDDAETTDSETVSTPQPESSMAEVFGSSTTATDYNRNVRLKVNQGLIVRGIARRSFDVRYFISEEFDASKTQATMEHGLLRITIPQKAEEELTINVDIKR
jgi:HSP20 family molecular chaperone IbpA